MKILDFIRRFAQFFRNRQQPVVRRQEPAPEEPRFTDDLPPLYAPIETQVSGQHLDGTSRWVGEDARVVQAPSGEIITCTRLRGVRCGCGHFIYTVLTRITETGILAGIGGTCPYCASEAEDLVQRNAVSASQAEALQLYCAQCASHCDGCGRQNLCRRHTAVFTDADGRQQLLCPDCLAKADRKKFFKQTVAFFGWFLAEDDTPSQPTQQGGDYDY
jgi:hypothetical protein